MTGEQKKPEYLAVNPTGYVPYFVDGDFGLSEGAAILTYIAEKYKLDAYPADPKLRAKVNQWLHWNHTAARKATLDLVRPALHGAADLAEAKKKFTSVLAFLEEQLAKSPTSFVAGTAKPSIADLFIITELDQLEAFGIFDLSAFENVAKFLADTAAAYPKSYPANYGAVKALVAKIKGGK